jgi:hypothetical protein
VNTRDPQTIIEKLKRLAPERIAEVEDFIDFLRARDEQHIVTSTAMNASERAFEKVWDNDADAEYDRPVIASATSS